MLQTCQILVFYGWCKCYFQWGNNVVFLWNMLAQFIPCSSYSASHSFYTIGTLASARYFKYISSKYWCFARVTPSEFNKLRTWFSIKVFSLKNVNGILIVCRFNDLMWSSNDNFKSCTNTKQQLVALVLWMLHNFLLIWYSNYHNYMHSFFKVCYKIKRKVMKIYVP